MTPRIIPVGEEPPPMDATGSPSSSNGTPRHQGEHGNKPKGTRQTRGRFQCVNAFIDATMAMLTPAGRATWLILWRDTKPNGLAIASQASIARRAGCSDRAVRDALRRLQAVGLLTVVHRGSLRRGASMYQVFPLTRGP
jgi:hypothetical protein